MSGQTAVATKPRAPKAKPEPAPGMKLTINRGDFLRALGFASAIVEQRNTIPVLSNVLLEAAGDMLRIVSTDLNLQIALNVPATVEGEGATTVSARLLHGIVREFNDGAQVDLKLDEGRLQVNSGRSRYKLQTIKSDDFPVIVPKDALTSFSLPAIDLLSAFRRVEFAQSSETIVRGYLCGVHLDTVDGELVFAATDGNRLAWSTMPAPEGAELVGAILPTKMISALGKLLDGHDGDVRLTFNERKVIAEIGTTVLTSKLVDGDYPSWRRVIPQSNGERLIVHTDAFAAAVRRAALISNERTRAIKIELSTDKMTVSAHSPEHGVAVEEAPCIWDGDNFAVGFNSRFLLDVLGAAGDGELQAEFHDAATPALFTNPADESAHWIVTPMRV